MWPWLISALPILGSIPAFFWGLKTIRAKKSLVLERGSEPLGLMGSASSPNEKRELEETKSYVGEDYQKRYHSVLLILEERSLENSSNNIYGLLHGLLEKLRELEVRLRTAENQHQANLVYTKYNPLIAKINELSSSKYYGSFVNQQSHWGNAEEMRKLVEKAILKTAQEANEDIRRLNSSLEFDFKVDVSKILGTEEANFGSSSTTEAFGGLLELSASVQAAQKDLDAVEAEANLELEEKLKESIQEFAVVEDALEEIAGIQAGTKDNLEKLEGVSFTGRTTILKSNKFRHHYQLFSPDGGATAGGKKNQYLVQIHDGVTGLDSWEKFNSQYEAADWIDSHQAELEKKHPFKHNCKYCTAVAA